MNARNWTCYPPQRIPNSETLGIRGLAYHLQRWPGQGGPLCILLHGWMDAGATFQFLVDALPPSWDVIAPDWRGCGQSAWSPGSYYFPEYLADLDALLNVLSPETPVWLVGHSMGGNVASLYAGIRPERVSRLVSLEGLGLPPSQSSQAPHNYQAWLREQAAPRKNRPYAAWSSFMERLHQANPRLPAERVAFIAHAWAKDSAEGPLLRADPRHKVRSPILYRLEEARACWRRIQAPVLWVLGEYSPFVRLNQALLDENRACFRDLREIRLADCGHMIHHEQPVAVAEAIVGFLAMDTA